MVKLWSCINELEYSVQNLLRQIFRLPFAIFLVGGGCEENKI